MAAAQTERDAQSAAQEAIRRLDLQTEVTREPEPFRIRLPPELLWVVIAVALGVVLYSFRDMVPLLRAEGRRVLGREEEIGGRYRAPGPDRGFGGSR